MIVKLVSNNQQENFFLVAGQALEVQKNLSVKTMGILLVPFFTEKNSPNTFVFGGKYATKMQRDCGCHGHYADKYWHKIDEIFEKNGEHFILSRGKPVKILNYNDVNFNSLDNPVIGLEDLCVKLKPNKIITRLYGIILDYNDKYIQGFSWDSLQKFIYIFTDKNNISKVLHDAFLYHKYCRQGSYKQEDLEKHKDNLNFLNFKIFSPRKILLDEERGEYLIDFDLSQAKFEYTDLLNNIK